eukprot:gene6452-biopygen521
MCALAAVLRQRGMRALTSREAGGAGTAQAGHGKGPVDTAADDPRGCSWAGDPFGGWPLSSKLLTALQNECGFHNNLQRSS